MFKHNLYLLAIAILAFIIAGLMSCNSQSNTDRHFGSDTSNLELVDLRDYQIELIPAIDYKVAPDSVQVWDGARFVGTVAIPNGSPLDSLIMADNE